LGTLSLSQEVIELGIERNKRDPKRRRTTAQRLKGRLKPVWLLPEAEPAAAGEVSKKSKGSAKKKAESSDDTKNE
jgi:hypothetical protein